MPSTHSPRLYYGWVIVAITALALLISAGVRSAPGVFLVPVQEDTQWSIGVISFAASMGLLVLGLTAPLGGLLIDRFGARHVAPAALWLIGVGMLLSAYVQAPWQLAVLWGGVSGVGTVYGWVFCSHQVGAALAAWGGGLVRDSLGSYALAFLVAGALALAGSLLALRIARSPKPAATVEVRPELSGA